MASSFFQSTRPLRGETQSENDSQQRSRLFNPLAPCGARLHRQRAHSRPLAFQSTRPLRGETASAALPLKSWYRFQSTRPLRGETANNHENCLQKIFVLHSPLSHKSAKRRLRKKNGLCQQENRHTFGANLPGIWCVLPVRITGSAVHPSKGRVIHHSAPLCCDSDCPAHRSERCRALHSFRSGSGA